MLLRLNLLSLFAAAGVALLLVGPHSGYAAEKHSDDQPHASDHAHDDAHHGDAAHGDAAHGEPNPLAVDLDLAVWTGVVFLALLTVLGKFAWPAICQALEEREQRIADNIAAAEAKHEDAKKLLAEHEARLASAADEVRELLEEARRDAEHTKGQIIAEAKKAAAEESQRAIREVEQAKDTALHDLATTSANLAIDLAGKVVSEEISAGRQSEIVREALGTLAATTPSNN